MKAVALVALLVIAAHSANGLAQLRTVRREQAAEAKPIAEVAAVEPKTEWVMAELKSEADSILEDGSNDESAAQDAADSRTAVAGPEEESLHGHFERFTKPMALLPKDHVTLVEVTSKADDDEGGGDKGSNPTYILPVDPFNYFPFFNGFSNVNPFSQFYPPPPYLYPQYTNYMHQYANHGAGHPPGYPAPGAYGGLGHAYGHGAHAGFPYNYPAAHPHMHYPFGAYKMDVSGPDVRTGTNNPPPFPQFMELAAAGKLITPEIIPRSADAAAAGEEDGEEEGDTVIAALIQTAEGADAEADADAEDEEEDSTEVEFEAEDEGEDEMAEDVEIADESEDESEMAEDVEIADEDEGEALSADGVEYLSEADESNEAEDVEYAL